MSGPIVPPLEVTEVDGSPDGRPITKLIVSSGDLTISGRTATIDTTGSTTTPATPANAIQFNSDPAGTFTGSERLLFETGSNVAQILMKSGASATQPEIRAVEGHGIQINATSAAGAIISEIVAFGENDAVEGIILLANNVGGTGAFVSIHNGELTTDTGGTSSGDLTITTERDATNAKITLNAGSNGDVDIQTDGTGITEIQNATTNQGTTLSVRGNGTGDSIIQLTNDSKAVSLKCDVNQKLKIDGGTQTFVFDASSATGGIQFPDGTSLISAEGTAILATGVTDGYVLTADGSDAAAWEAAGGSSDPLNPILGALSLTGSNTRYETAAASPYGVAPNKSTNWGVLWDDFCELYPFIAVKAGQLSEFGTKFGTSSSGGMVFAIYDSNDTTQMPDTLLAHGSIVYSSNASVYQTSLTAPTGTGVVGSLVAGNQYWCCYIRHTAGTATNMKALENNYRCRITPIAECGDHDGALLQTTDYTASSTFPDTFDTTNLVPENNYIPRFSYKVT